MRAIAIHDDFTLVGPPAEVFRAYERFVALLAEAGLTLTTRKCRLLIPRHGEAPSPAIVDFVARTGVTLHEHSSMELLGGRVGTLDDDATKAWLHEQIMGHERLFTALGSRHIKKQIAMLLLRSCGLPLLNFLVRVLPGRLMTQSARSFDQRIEECFMQITGIDAAEMKEAQKQFRLPIKFGGLGFRSYLRMLHACYVASFAMAIPRIALCPDGALLTPQQDAVQHSLLRLRGQLHRHDEFTPPTLAGLFETYRGTT